MKVKVKRVYESPSKNDGVRILVDRLWPRGMKKEDAHLDYWLKDIAPSHSLRKQYHGDELSHREFVAHYKRELQHDATAQSALQKLRELTKKNTCTLLVATKDIEHAHAHILVNMLQG